MNKKELKNSQTQRSEKKLDCLHLGLIEMEERCMFLSQSMLPSFYSCFSQPEYKTPSQLPHFQSICSIPMQVDDAKDNPTRTFCTIFINRDVSSPDGKLRLRYCFQNDGRLFKCEWTKGFFG